MSEKYNSADYADREYSVEALEAGLKLKHQLEAITPGVSHTSP